MFAAKLEEKRRVKMDWEADELVSIFARMTFGSSRPYEGTGNRVDRAKIIAAHVAVDHQ